MRTAGVCNWLVMVMDGENLNFGRKIGEFKTETSHFIAALAGGLLLAVVGLVRFMAATSSAGGVDMFNLLLSTLFLYLGGVLLFFAFMRYQEMRTRYTLYEQGVQRHDGPTQQAIGWDQVSRVRREADGPHFRSGAGRRGKQRRWRRIKLIGQGGKSVTISNQPRLAGMILGMLLVHRWPIVQGQIEAGQKIYLSRLWVSKEGLEYKGRLVPWSKIYSAKTSGHISLDTVSGRINWPEINDQDTSDVLGFLLLQRAIEYYVGRQG